MQHSLKKIIKPFIPQTVLREYQNIKIKKMLKPIPEVVGIENTNCCNAHCITCPHGTSRRKLGFMDINLSRHITDECVRLGIKNLAIGFFGEPLLDTLLIDRIDYAKKKGIEKVTTFSNAGCLNEDISRRLIESDLDKITISIDGLEQETYERVNIGLDYNKVSENVEKFIAMKRTFNNKKLSVIICSTVVEENRHEMEAYRSKYSKMLKDDGEVVLIAAFNWGGKHKINDAYIRKNRVPCHRPWNQLIFLIDGTAVLCCCDYDANVVVGDINKQSIPEIWKGAVLEDIRKCHLAREFVKIPLCNECSENYSVIQLKEGKENS